MDVIEKRRSIIINIVYYGLIIAMICAAFHYGFGLLMPLLLALVFAALLQRPKNFLTRKTPMSKGVASAFCVFGTIFIIFVIFYLIGAKAVTEIRGFVDYIVIRLKDIDSVVNAAESTATSIIQKLPEFISGNLTESTAKFFSQLREFLAGQSNDLAESITGTVGDSFSFSWISKPLSSVVSTASKLPSFFVSVLICIVATCFMTADFDFITRFVDAQLSDKQRDNYRRAKSLLKSSMSKMGKAYLLIILVTFSEMTIGLSVLKLLRIFDSNYIIIIAFATAIIDIVPVLGTGTVVIPWALVNLFTGDYKMAVGLVIIYIIITVIRQIIEPKLVAGQLGLPSFLTICAMFIGLKTIGVLGIFVAPMIVVMLKLLNDEGILKLWKTPEESKEEEKPKKESKLKALLSKRKSK